MPLEPGVGKVIVGAAVVVVVLAVLMMNTHPDVVAPDAVAPAAPAREQRVVNLPLPLPPSPSMVAAQPIDGSDQAQPDRPDVTVTAVQLWHDYDANEVAADEKYRGAPLVVTGIVVATRKDVFGKPYVELASGRLFQGVHARFAEGHTDVLSSFRRGDKIVVRCIGNNVMVGSPQLKECSLEHRYRWGKSE